MYIFILYLLIYLANMRDLAGGYSVDGRTTCIQNPNSDETVQLIAVSSVPLSKDEQLCFSTYSGPRIMLLYLRSGSGVLEQAAGSQEIHTRAAAVLPCWQNWKLSASSDLGADIILFCHPHPEQFILNHMTDGLSVHDVSGQAKFSAMISQFSHLPLPLSLPQNTRRLRQLLREWSACVSQISHCPKDIPPHIQAMKELMDTHYSEDLTLDVMASQLKKNKYQLIRAFANVYGSTPGAYLTSVRLTQAARLLRYSRMPVKEISRQVGFRNDAYFISLFKKHYGLPPRKYRLTQQE